MLYDVIDLLVDNTVTTGPSKLLVTKHQNQPGESSVTKHSPYEADTLGQSKLPISEVDTGSINIDLKLLIFACVCTG